MSLPRAIFHTAHTAALGIWLGSILAVGAAAAVTFPTLKTLDAKSPAYSGYTGDQWLIVGGQVAARIFYAGDVIQFVCAVLAFAPFAVLIALDRPQFRTRRGIARVLALAALFCVFCYYFFVFSPQFTVSMREFWAAAGRGDNTAAAALKTTLDSDHPVASRLLGIIAGLLLIGFIMALWPRPAKPIGEPAPTRPRSNLEVPHLARAAGSRR